MAKIQPLTLWTNGESKEANNFTLRSIGDNLSTEPLKGQATLYYELQAVTTIEEAVSVENIITSTLEISGEDYDLWNSDPTSNAWALNWAVSKLKLVLIQE